VTAPYTVTWSDRAGPYDSKRFDSFEEALAAYRKPRGMFADIHGDGAEFDGERWFDGLTDEEREEL